MTGKGLCLLCAAETLPDAAGLAAAVAAVLGVPLPDAAAALRHGWGFVAEDASPGEAEKLLAACAAAGIELLALPAPAAPLAEPLKVKKLVLEAGAIGYEKSGALFRLAAADIRVVSAAPVKRTRTKTVKTSEGPSAGERAVRMGVMAVTGLPIGLGKSKEVSKTVSSTESGFRLGLLAADGTRLRADAEDFDFSCLGPEKTYSGQTNLRLLALKLAALCGAAFFNAGLRAMRESKPLSTLPYEGEEDLDKEEFRLWLARTARP